MSQEQRSSISGSVWDVYQESSDAYKESRMPRVGQIVCFEDGRRFEFCASQVAHALGETVAAPSGSEEIVSGTVYPGQNIVNIAGIVGAPANFYADGQITAADASTYKIKSSRPSTAAGIVELTLYDNIVVSMVDTDAVLLTSARNWNTVVGNSANDIIGITNQLIPAATGTFVYFWVQTSGPAGVFQVLVTGITLMQTASGALVASDGTRQQIGYVLTVGSFSSQIFLTCSQVL